MMRFRLLPQLVPSRESRGRVARFAMACTIVAGLAGLVLNDSFVSAVGQEEEESIVGVYTVAIGESDVSLTFPGGPSLFGLWDLAFNDDGSYVLARQDVGPLVAGSYEVTGGTLTVVDEIGLLRCGGDPASGDDDAAEGVYGWEMQEDHLTLSPVQDECATRRLLFSTRPFGGFAACLTEPLFGEAASPVPATEPRATPVAISGGAAPAATPQASGGTDASEQIQSAIDDLLAQATGCWATGDPMRFLPLHGQTVLEELTAGGFIDQVLSDLAMFMATPVSFERIGNVQLLDPAHAWVYVEITFDGEPIPQRFDFVLQDGIWLFDTFFLFGPTPTTQP